MVAQRDVEPEGDERDPFAVGREVREPVAEIRIVRDLLWVAAVGTWGFPAAAAVVSPLRGRRSPLARSE